MPRNEQRPIRYTKHAEQRMAKRAVSPAEVERVIRTGSWAPNVGEGWISRASIGGRTLDVVFIETTDEDGEALIEVLLVVTVIDKGRYRA